MSQEPDPVPHAPDAIETIVVPLDGSTFSQDALPVATRLAARFGASVHLLSAVESADEVDARAQSLAAIDAVNLQVTRTVVVEHDPAAVISAELRESGRTMVCMASHGRARSAALLGSVATSVIERRGYPLVLVCPYTEQATNGRGVVACVDGTPESESLVQLAIGWADLLGEPTVVLTVADDVPIEDGEPVRRQFGPKDPEAVLHALVSPERTAGRAVQAVAWLDPIAVWSGVHDYLREHPAALVLAGAHRRGRLARLLSGSASAAIVRHSPSPVLLVPRPD